MTVFLSCICASFGSYFYFLQFLVLEILEKRGAGEWSLELGVLNFIEVDKICNSEVSGENVQVHSPEKKAFQPHFQPHFLHSFGYSFFDESSMKLVCHLHEIHRFLRCVTHLSNDCI